MLQAMGKPAGTAIKDRQSIKKGGTMMFKKSYPCLLYTSCTTGCVWDFMHRRGEDFLRKAEERLRKDKRRMEQNNKQDSAPIMVSVSCITFNHEPYIARALDSFLMQKTNFPFEILIYDDASTDHTQEIIREYEKRYPGIIKPYYLSLIHI